MNDNKKLIIESAKKVLEIESREILNAEKNIDEHFAESVLKVHECKGRTILSGMGKSGHIARKIASTLSSTGTPSFFMHPGEASHGDLGMITKDDVVIFLSNSGESDEIYNLIPAIKRIKATIIAITGNDKSEIAKYADFHISSKVTSEACPLGLAPTASSALMLAIGDALAISLFQLKGFTIEDFLKTHPGGSLGKNKLLKTEDIMRQESSFPNVQANTVLVDVIQFISDKKVGFAVVSENEKPIGMFTDGDLRRALLKNASLKDPIKLWMSSNPLFINENSLAINAAEIMEKNKVSSLIVVDENLFLRGVVNFQDLLIHKVI